MSAVPQNVLAAWRDIPRVARQYTGSTLWLYSVAKDNFAVGTNKCNKFVFDVIVEAGVSPRPTVPRLTFGLFRNGLRPPTAGEWATSTVHIPGWVVVTTAQAGDVVAEAHQYSDATGHVGIVVGDRQTASASSAHAVAGTIVVNDWGFRSDSAPTFRRFVGTA